MQKFSVEPCVLVPSASTVLSRKFLGNSIYFTPFLSVASLSTYGRSIHQSSLSNQSEALIFLNFCVAMVTFV